jgi:tetratricopeptide (TPR) repeat protein
MPAAWWWSGPVFLLMANMPPNPHAAAIVEPHYLLSDLVLVLWAAEGVGSALVVNKGLAWAACALLAAVPLWKGRVPQMDRREHLFSYDYARNVFRAAAPGGTVVAKKDVQLYLLWHYQTVQGWRPDLRLVSQGLAGSLWYEAQERRSQPALFVGPLRDAAEWRRFIGLDAPVYATMDCDVPPEVSASAHPLGLLNAWPASPEPAARAGALWELMVRRGRYEYEGQPDFFTSDLVGNYAQALYLQGRQSYAAGAAQAATEAFERAWSMQWTFADPAGFLGFAAFQRGEYRKAADYYTAAAGIDDDMMLRAQEYHALPDVRTGIRRAAAEASMQLGAIAERLQDKAAAQADYERSLALFPTAQTHYNLAVLFWGRDMSRAEAELVEALRLEPRHPEANKYLAILRARR